MGCVWMFGMITKHRKHALVIFAVMTVLCLVKLGCAITFESEPAVALHDLPVAEASNLEGKSCGSARAQARCGRCSRPAPATVR